VILALFALGAFVAEHIFGLEDQTPLVLMYLIAGLFITDLSWRLKR
jgi:hypothetical protein